MRTDALALGDLRGVIYTFERAGDVLPMHNHNDDDAHMTVVARGSFRIHGPTIGETVAKEGAVLDFEAGHEHEFIALSDNARLVNIIKKTQR